VRKKLTILLLVGAMCLLGATVALAYNEAPMLRVKVAAGELPPVEKRLPEEPSVLKPLEEIGQYGGTLHVFATDNSPWNDMTEEPERGTYFGRMAEDGKTVVGDLAKGFKLADDGKSFTLYLRKGVKWSDGVPFTADDIVFLFEDMIWNDKLPTWNWLEGVKRVKKIDDYTVRYEMDEPYPVILLKMIGAAGGDWFSFQPKHYLKKWHIKYNPKADELAKKEGFDHWWECMYYHYWWAPQKDLNKPTLQPWIMKESTPTYKLFERNPYYWKVDTAGNQLPYIDRIVSTIVSKDVYQMKVISGEADVAWMRTSLENYPLYKENEDRGGYRVILIPGDNGADIALGINQNKPDPKMRKIYQDVRFRQALSLAINREEINEVAYFGLAVPRQATVLPSCSFYKKEWGEAYAQYDPDEANRLLDAVGLTKRDKNGFRIGPDGKPMLILVEFSQERYGAVRTALELIKEYWEAVGLMVELKEEDITLFAARKASPDHDVIVSVVDCCGEIPSYMKSGVNDWTRPNTDLAWGPTWGDWLDAEYEIRMGRKTLEDFGGKLPGEEPPQEIKDLFEWGKLKQRTKFRSKEYMEISQKIFDTHAKNLFIIGVVGMAPVVYIAKNNIGNVPQAYGPGMSFIGDLNYYGEQLFFKQ